MTDKQKALLMLNGVGLLVSAVVSGWLHFFQLLGEIDLWPFINHVEAEVPGEARAWIMAHLEGLMNGTLLMLIALTSGYYRLSARLQTVLVYCAIIFGWMFTLPAIANAWFGTRGLAMDGGPWLESQNSLANNLIFVSGWPAMAAVHIAFALMIWGAYQHYRSIPK